VRQGRQGRIRMKGQLPALLLGTLLFYSVLACAAAPPGSVKAEVPPLEAEMDGLGEGEGLGGEEGRDLGNGKGGGEGYEPTLDGEDDDIDGKYLHESLNAISEEQLLAEEKAYFHTRDHDGDGVLNKEEFLRQLDEEIAHIFEADMHAQVSQEGHEAPPQDDEDQGDDASRDAPDMPYEELLEGDEDIEQARRAEDHEAATAVNGDGTMVGYNDTEGAHVGELSEEELKREAELQAKLDKLEQEAGVKDGVKYVPPPSYKHERKVPLPNHDALLFGKDWTSRVPLHEGEEAFARFDSDQDGKVSWNEWKTQMFHEDPQMPQFRDGEPRVYDPSGLADDEINPEDLKQMEETFREFDQDKDEYLTSSDVYKVLAKHRDEPMFPDAVEQWERQSDEELKKAAEEMMEGYDTNKDGRLTMKEWIGGGGF